MTTGLLVTGFVAYLLYATGAMAIFYNISPEGYIVGMNALGWIALLSPLVLVFMFSSAVAKMNPGKAAIIFFVFAALMGVSLGNIFLIYTGASLFKTFFITAALFGGMSIYGYTTRRDLTAMGSFMIMGLWGIILATLVNIFLGSTGVDFVISILAIIIFTGLTAYDTQKIRGYYVPGEASARADSKAILGALSLYLDAINLFIYLLRFVGDRR
jgi:FtsH-binding integral membrane protein